MLRNLINGCFNACFSLQNFAEDKLREELRKLQEDKCQYQGTAKESLRKVLQEKLEAVQKMQDLERYSGIVLLMCYMWITGPVNKTVTNQWQSQN
jgi:hypothetical protein